MKAHKNLHTNQQNDHTPAISSTQAQPGSNISDISMYFMCDPFISQFGLTFLMSIISRNHELVEYPEPPMELCLIKLAINCLSGHNFHLDSITVNN